MLAKDLKCIFSDKRMVMLLIAVFIIGAIGVFFSVGNNTEPIVKMGIADMDNSEYSHLLVTYFDENKDFTSYISVTRGTDVELEERFNQGELDAYMVIPKGFTESLMNIQNDALKVVINSADTSKSVLLTNMMGAYADYVTGVQMNCQALIDLMYAEGFDRQLVKDTNFDVSLDLVFVALSKSDYFERVEIERFKGISLVNYYIYSVIILIVLYGGMFAGMNALRERLGKAGERMKSLGISGFSIYSAKLIAYFIVYAVMLVALMFIMKTFGDIDIPIITMLALMPIIAGTIIIFLLISRIAKTINSYVVFGNMFIILMTIAGGGVIPIMYMPEVCVNIARLTPTYWFIRFICDSL